MDQESQNTDKQLSPGPPPKYWSDKIYIGIISIYAILVVSNLIFQWVLLNYLLTLISPGIAYIIPELVGERKKNWKWLLFTSIPVFGIAGLQLTSTRVQDRELKNIKIGTLREIEFKENERHFYEKVIVNPGEVISELLYADEGFAAEAQVIFLRIAERESALLGANSAIVARKVLEMPDDPKQKIEAYKAIRGVIQQQGKKEGYKSLLLIGKIENLLNRQITYESLADLGRELKTSYEEVIFNADRGKLEEAKVGLKEIGNRLLKRTELNTAGGYFNNLSVVSLGQSSPEEALGWLYQGIYVEPEHVLTYETLAYALWALNQDSRTALRYAERGLEFNSTFVEQVRSDYQNCMRRYNEFLQGNPSSSSLLQKKLRAIHKHYPSIERLATEYENDLEARFKNQVCYFSAIELTNEKISRKYAEELHELYPEDLDYQETLGFVLMRFASSVEELETALGHLETVKEYAQTPLTRDLASAHYQVGLAKQMLLARQ